MHIIIAIMLKKTYDLLEKFFITLRQYIVTYNITDNILHKVKNRVY